VTPFAVGGPYLVQLMYYYPDLNSPYFSPGVEYIGPSVEYPDPFFGQFSVNLKLRKIIITYLNSGGYGTADFNGPVFTSLTSGAYLPQPAYFISSTIDTSLMNLTSTPTTIALNLQGHGGRCDYYRLVEVGR
jgi:hypothetical protein